MEKNRFDVTGAYVCPHAYGKESCVRVCVRVCVRGGQCKRSFVHFCLGAQS